jgi:uracil-DNA glycosylase family 4
MWKDKIRNPNCTLCPLHEGAQHVCLMGSGSRKSKIMIVGEAPGEREDDSAQAFVGPAGRLLTEVLEKAGISRDDCYITNAVKCRPPNNRQPTPGEAKVCGSTYLSEEISRVGPTHILALGNTSLKALTRKSGITKHRGSSFPGPEGSTVFATFHPAYVLRSPFHGASLQADIARFARMVGGEDQDEVSKTGYVIVDTVEKLKKLRRNLMKAEVVTFDIETNFHKKVQEYSSWHPEFRIVTISFTWRQGHSAVVPLYHPGSPWKDPDRVLRYLKPSLERPDGKYVAHNGPFDARGLAAHGVFVKLTFDTMLAAHMLEENRLKGLEPLSESLLGVQPYKIHVGDKGAHNFPLKEVCKYNAQDTDYTHRLYQKFKGELREEPRIARVFAKLMMPAANAMTVVEQGGPWIDPDRYERRLRKTIRQRDKVEAKLRKSCGDINLRSPQQIGKWLFRDLGLPVIEETDTGAPSTSEAVILRLAQQSPELRLLLEYRKWESKYIRTYFAAWANRDENSRFHPGYKLFGTVTGRLSGDFQQVPRDPFMRSIVGAPPGWTFVEADYSQAELRIAAWLADERRLLRVFAEGRDPHMETAELITGKVARDITSEERKKAKSVNFGFLFGMWYKKYIEYAFQNYELEVSEAEAKKFYDRWHEAYPAFRRWHDRQKRLVHRYGRVHSPIGRVRHLPTVRSSDQGMVKDAERQAINSPVQSFASDLMLLSLVRLVDTLPSTRARIVGTVHDSILFEVRNDYVEEALPLIHETMVDTKDVKRKFGTDIRVPIEVEIKVGQHWGEGEVWTPEK